MMNPGPLLQSKLCFLGASHTIDRGRLKSLFDQMLRHRLTTIIAGAGYGKSTLTAQAVEYLNVPAVWFRMDKHDKDLTTFLTYLVSGLRRHFPEIGSDILSELNKGLMAPKGPESMIRILLSALQHEVRTDILIIFDDFHAVQDAQEVEACMLDLIRNMPACMHLIIISRTEPAWPLALVRARRQVLDIREPHLNFTALEIAGLYSEIFQFRPDDEIVSIIHQKTAGWVSGAILFYHTLQGRKFSEIKELVHNLNGSHDIIAAYLEENVYQRQSQEAKEFLLSASLLDRIHVDLCRELFPGCDAAHILMELENKHLFTFSVDATRREYHFHQLFRDFLKIKLKQLSKPKEIQSLNRKIASLFEKRGLLEEALDHYCRGHCWKSACRLFRDAGRWMLLQGQMQKFSSFMANIPPRYAGSEPMIQYMQAHAVLFEHGRAKAAKHFRTALKKSRKKEDIQVEYLSLKEIALEQAETGNYSEAVQRFKALLDIPPKALDLKYRLEINLAVMISLLRSLAILGLFEQAGHYLDGIKKITDALADGNSPDAAKSGFEVTCGLLESLLEIHTGDPVRALNLLNRIFEQISHLDIHHLFLMYYYLKAHASICTADYKQALKASESGLALQKRFMAGSEMYGWLKYFRGRAYLGIGQPTEARIAIDEARIFFKAAKNYHGLTESYLGLYYVALSTGTRAKASVYLKASHETLPKCTVPALEGAVLAQSALSKLDRGDFTSAAKLFKQAKQATKSFPVQQAIVLCLRAQYYWLQGRKAFAVNYLSGWLRALAQNFDSHQEKTWQFIPIIPLLVDTYADGITKPFLTKLFKQIGSAGHAELTDLTQDAKPPARKAAATLLAQIAGERSPFLDAQFFKSFSLNVGGKILTNDDWKNKKALLLFKYLLISRKKGFLPKEVLMEFLWPEEDPKKTTNRLHVTLNALRKSLESESTDKFLSLYLERKGDKYRLADSKIKRIDIEFFEDEIKLGKTLSNPAEAVLHFQKAEMTYTGDFLEDELYAEWCFELRNHLKQQYMNLMPPILDYFEAQDDLQTCIQYAEKFLARDRFNEEVYQKLMRYHFLMGDQRKVLRIFNQCKKVINEELDTPLTPQTISLYQTFSGDDQ